MTKKHTILFWFENKQEEQKLMDYLQEHGFRCISCTGKENFEELISSVVQNISMVVIDLSLKETDAILACNEIKNRKNVNNPFVVIVSDKDEEYTQVTALDLGADDYILKPIKAALFLKRILALSRRKNHAVEHSQNSNGFFIDVEKHLVVIDEDSYELPKKEFELLNLLYSVPNKIFSREEIAVLLWKEESIARQRTIDVHIRNIRKTLGRDLIKTVKGFGYGLNWPAGT